MVVNRCKGCSIRCVRLSIDELKPVRSILTKEQLLGNSDIVNIPEPGIHSALCPFYRPLSPTPVSLNLLQEMVAASLLVQRCVDTAYCM
jgi:hypothetical protein